MRTIKRTLRYSALLVGVLLTLSGFAPYQQATPEPDSTNSPDYPGGYLNVSKGDGLYFGNRRIRRANAGQPGEY